MAKLHAQPWALVMVTLCVACLVWYQLHQFVGLRAKHAVVQVRLEPNGQAQLTARNGRVQVGEARHLWALGQRWVVVQVTLAKPTSLWRSKTSWITLVKQEQPDSIVATNDWRALLRHVHWGWAQSKPI